MQGAARKSRQVILLGSGLRVAPGEGRCSVCGESVEEAPTFCSVCFTPHHERCWRYNGRCGIFGCGSSVLTDSRQLTADPFSAACLAKAIGWAGVVCLVAWFGALIH